MKSWADRTADCLAESPAQLRSALSRAKKATVEGKPYLIDAQVARMGVAWAQKPWIPPISIAGERERNHVRDRPRAHAGAAR